MNSTPIRRVVLYKHGVGYFEREGQVENDCAVSLTFREREVSDVLKSLTVLDLDGGHIASVSYDSTKPLEQLLAEVALSIPDQGSLVNLLPQLKGARIALHTGVSDPCEGILLGIDSTERQTGDGIVRIVLVSVLTDRGDVRSMDLHNLASVELRDPALRRDLEFYLKTMLSSKKKDSRTFTFFAQGQGSRRIRLSYTLESPVWKATYRILLNGESKQPMIQGWAVVDNTQDEDWNQVQLSLIAGLPVSFVHDLYTPRYIRRPEIAVLETTGVLPPVMEMAMVAAGDLSLEDAEAESMMLGKAVAPASPALRKLARADKRRETQASSVQTQVRERKIGDLFEYEIEHPVTIQRNQSALVPIVLKEFSGRAVLLYNKANRPDNPMRCVEFKNTTELTLEGGPVTVLDSGNYVGEAMLETIKPDEERLVPYAVELGVHVLDNIDSHQESVHRIVIRRGCLYAHFLQIQKTTYHCNNKSDVEQIVVLEHPRAGEWKLVDTPEPFEITENYWRFRFSLPAKKVTKFTIQQQLVMHHSYQLDSVSDKQLQVWIQQKYVDAKTSKVLAEAISLRQEIGRLEQLLATLERERQSIHTEQKRIRDNMGALGERASEKDLRERFVRTLNSQENRLEAIDKEARDNAEVRDTCREKMNEVLAKLEYEVDVKQ